MPLSTRFKCPVCHICSHLFSVAIFPLLAMNHRRYEWTEVVTSTHNFLTYFNRVLNALRPEVTTSFTILHLSVYVKCCKEWIEWRCRCMHHECVINYLVVYITILSLNMFILLMNLRCHREACLLLMNRLGYENSRIIWTKIKE